MIADCPVCGKRFVVYWPDLWPYRRKDVFLCRDSCVEAYVIQEYRKKVGWIDDYYRRKNEMKKVTLEQKKKAVEIAIGGGDPLKFLKECGSANPSATWYFIKKTLKEKDPEKYAQIPGAEEKKYELQDDLKDEAPDDEEEDDRMTVTTCCAPSTREGVEVPDELPEDVIKAIKEPWHEIANEKKTAGPVNYGGFDVSAVRDPETGDEFYYDKKYKSLDWRTSEGEEVSMSPAGWRKFAEKLPQVMEILGI